MSPENLVKSSAHFSRHEAEVLLNVSPGFCCPPYSAGLGIKGKFGQNCNGTAGYELEDMELEDVNQGHHYVVSEGFGKISLFFLPRNTPPMVTVYF